jgi:hypothetical protein
LHPGFVLIQVFCSRAVEGAKPVTDDVYEAMLNRTWRPTVSTVGVAGIPSLDMAGNVLRTHTAVKLSIRLPPRVNAPQAAAFLKQFLEKDPPYGAKVTFEWDKAGSGWDAPALAPWLEKSLNDASNLFYKKPANFLGEGGSIPFMGKLLFHSLIFLPVLTLRCCFRNARRSFPPGSILRYWCSWPREQRARTQRDACH